MGEGIGDGGVGMRRLELGEDAAQGCANGFVGEVVDGVLSGLLTKAIAESLVVPHGMDGVGEFGEGTGLDEVPGDVVLDVVFDAATVGDDEGAAEGEGFDEGDGACDDSGFDHREDDESGALHEGVDFGFFEAKGGFDVGGDRETFEGAGACDDDGAKAETADDFKEESVVAVGGAEGEDEGGFGVFGFGEGEDGNLHGDKFKAIDGEVVPTAVGFALGGVVDDEAIDGLQSGAGEGVFVACVEVGVEPPGYEGKVFVEKRFLNADQGGELGQYGDDAALNRFDGGAALLP